MPGRCDIPYWAGYANKKGHHPWFLMIITIIWLVKFLQKLLNIPMHCMDHLTICYCIFPTITTTIWCKWVCTNLKLRLKNKLFCFSETHSNQGNLMLNISVNKLPVLQNRTTKTETKVVIRFSQSGGEADKTLGQDWNWGAWYRFNAPKCG